MNRREFVRNSGLTAAAVTILPENPLFASSKADKVKIAIIGVGLRGQNHLDLLLKRDDVDLVAICDVEPRMLNTAKAMIAKSGKPMPKIFTGDDNAWKKMLKPKDCSRY